MGRLQKKRPAGKKKKKAQRQKKAGADQSQIAIAAKSSAQPAVVKKEDKKKKVVAKKAPAPAKTAAGAQDKNIFKKSIQFLREVKVELKKVTWPSRKQAIGSTVVVIVLVMLISLFLGVVDIGLSSLIRVVLQ